MMRFQSYAFAVLAAAGIFISGMAKAQDAAVPQSAAEMRMLYFDEAVGFKTFKRLSVFRSWGDRKTFFLLPNGIRESKSSGMSLQYDSASKTLTGVMTMTLEPAFEEDEFLSIANELKEVYPDGLFSVAEPVHSEWEVQGFGISKTVTPILMSNPLLSGSSVTIEIPALLTRLLLHNGSHYSSAFVVRHKFAVRGIELDASMRPRIATRWFSRGVSFPGGCGLAPERYLDVRTGQTGCIFKIRSSREQILEAQTLLKSTGYYASAVDGIAGPKTRLAIKAFQAEHGLVQDGQISSILIDRMREAAKET